MPDVCFEPRGRVDASVGTSGMVADGFVVVTARARSRPARTCGWTTRVTENPISTSPEITALINGPPPRYGTCTAPVPASRLNSTPDRWLVVPLPFEPKLSPSLGLTRECHEFLDIARGHRGVGCQHQRNNSSHRDRCEVLLQVVAEFRVQGCIDRDRVGGEHLWCTHLGSDFATTSAPTFPPAPARFSGTTA